MRPWAWVHTPAGPSAASELGQLGAWRRHPHPARTEIDDQDGVILDADDPAEAVLIVCHLVLHGELLGRRSEGRGAEGTCGQERPGSRARKFHHDQYAPLRLAGSSSLPRVRPRRAKCCWLAVTPLPRLGGPLRPAEAHYVPRISCGLSGAPGRGMVLNGAGCSQSSRLADVLSRRRLADSGVDELQNPCVSAPTESPQSATAAHSPPRKPHVRNGITRYKTARLLTWPCQPWNAFMQAGQGDVADSTGRPQPRQAFC